MSDDMGDAGFPTKKPKLSEIRALWDKTTPGDWIVRTHPQKDDFFVEAPAANGEAYGTEILGDEDYSTKRADAEAIVKAKTFHPYLLDLVSRLGKALEGLRGHRLDGIQCWCFNELAHADHASPCKEARALLEEIEL